MFDHEIRAELLSGLRREHPRALVVEEFSIDSGDARADIAILGRWFHGHEIKGDADSLRRLPGQVIKYGQVFDFLTLTAWQGHLPEAFEIIPDWWGVNLARRHDELGDLVIATIRRPRRNPAPNPEAIAFLLWRDEAAEELARLGSPRGAARWTRSALCLELARRLPIRALRAVVRGRIKARRAARARS